MSANSVSAKPGVEPRAAAGAGAADETSVADLLRAAAPRFVPLPSEDCALDKAVAGDSDSSSDALRDSPLAAVRGAPGAFVAQIAASHAALCAPRAASGARPRPTATTRTHPMFSRSRAAAVAAHAAHVSRAENSDSAASQRPYIIRRSVYEFTLLNQACTRLDRKFYKDEMEALIPRERAEELRKEVCSLGLRLLISYKNRHLQLRGQDLEAHFEAVADIFERVANFPLNAVPAFW